MKHHRGFILAIDGPAGSGKSTTARLCAERLGFRHLDTGAMYRAVTMKVLASGLGRRQRSEGRSQKAEAHINHQDTKTRRGTTRNEDPAKREGVLDQSALASLLRRTSVSVVWDRRGMRTLLDGRDVSEEIRSPEVSGFVSEVSTIPMVRRKMVAEQRRVAAGHAIVCEGRDIGSVVFPDADLKIFLECDTRERARRRQLELRGQGVPARQSAVQANLEKRDRIDSGREISPLRRMPDAILVDTSHLTIEEQTAIVCDLAKRRMEAG